MQQHVFAISQTCEALGITHAVICPGSRSAPLVFAFTQQKNITCYTVIDERSAAYMALGMAQQLRKPVALICTSGTAALNFYPAVAEAFYQRIPLLVLTADRPPHLLHQQDGQMIDQRNVYGTHVRGSYMLPCYDHGKENLKKTTVIVADAIARSSSPAAGPVHINVPLTEPLYPEKNKAPQLHEQVSAWLKKIAEPAVNDADFDALEKAWIGSKKRMIIVGLSVTQEKWITPLLALREHDDVVVLADVASNQHAMATTKLFDGMIGAADPKILKQLEPDLVVSFGGPVLSKSLKLWLKKQQPVHFRIQTEEEQINTYQHRLQTIYAKPEDTLNRLASIEWRSTPEKTFENAWQRASLAYHNKTLAFTKQKTWSELHATSRILQAIPDGSNLHLSNSSAIRYASMTGEWSDSWIMNSNRGTSGIDGCTSTAVGAAIVNNRQTVLITGDLGFLYDRNALWNEHVPPNLRIVVLNNFGGGIFTLIDGPSQHKQQLPYFTTPHKQLVKATALQNGLDYYFCDSIGSLEKQLKTFFEPYNKAAVLELSFDMKQNASVFKAFKKLKF